MLPIYIICHAKCDPPGYLCSYFDSHNIPFKKYNFIKNGIDQIDLDATSGIIFMGGEHSVTEKTQWIEDEIKIIHQAIDRDLPLMGVCFGAQLISKALGAEVCAARHMETGWHRISVDTSRLPENNPLELGDSIEVFEWHEDTFSIPEGAIPIFRSHGIENQGYLLGKIFTMQFHLEMTEHMVHEWIGRYNDCLPRPTEFIQSPDQITDRLEERLENLHKLADRIYAWWINMLKT